MGVYLYRLNGKTIHATNTVTGKPVSIALAPYFTKPWSEEWDWIENIERYRNYYTRWQSVAERMDVNQKELHGAGIYQRSPNDSEYERKTREYWWYKRKINTARRMKEKFDQIPVKLVVFSDNKEIRDYLTPTSETLKRIHVYELNDSMWADTPDYGTPCVGTIHSIGKRIYYTPYPKNADK